jgi:hypothetical protein
MSPAKCGLCGYSNTDRQYLDFAGKLDFEWYGSLAICEQCVAAMAADFGFIQPAQALALEARVEEAERELVTLRAAVLQLESLHDLIAGLAGDSANILNRNDGMVVRSDEPAQPIPAQSINIEGQDDSGSDKQTPVEGSDDLSDLISSADKLLEL